MQKNPDTRIIICAHKPFEVPVHNPCYTIVSTGEHFDTDIEAHFIDKTEEKGYDDLFFSELYQMKWAKENGLLDRTFTGLNHYRRYFEFMDNDVNLQEVFKKFEVIVPSEFNLGMSVQEQYGLCHNLEDLYLCGEIIKELYPDYYNTFESFIRQPLFYMCNMSIMRTEDFSDWIDFVFSILNRYIELIGGDVRKHIEENSEKYTKEFEPNSSLDYQFRIGGYLGERLTDTFILRRFKRIGTCHIIKTETKYESEIEPQ